MGAKPPGGLGGELQCCDPMAPSGDDGDMGTEILAMIGDYCCISLAYAFCVVKYERFQV